MSPTSARRRSLTAVLILVGASTMLTGCGDDGAHLPAGMAGSSSSLTASGGSSALASGVEDPVLQDASLDIGAGMGDDIWSQANEDFASSAGGLDTVGLDDMPPLEDDLMPVGYGGDGGYGGYGSGYDDGLGYGSGFLSTAGYGGLGSLGGFGGDAFGGAGLMDGGLIDDPSLGAGFDDPGMGAAAFDPGFSGGMDAGIDPGFSEPMVDPGFSAPSPMGGAGFDPGPAVGGVGGFDSGPAGVGGAVEVGGADIMSDQLAVF